MKTPEYYQSDIRMFFDGRPSELLLYEALFRRMEADFPQASVKVQKSQVSFYGRHLFAMVSLPKRKRDAGILVSLGLPCRLESPRVAVSVEPYPNRWTHHIPVTAEEQLDEELLGWLREAWAFSEQKR